MEQNYEKWLDKVYLYYEDYSIGKRERERLRERKAY